MLPDMLLFLEVFEGIIGDDKPKKKKKVPIHSFSS